MNSIKIYISTVGWLNTYYAHVLKSKNLECSELIFNSKNEFLNLFRHVFILFQTKNVTILFHHVFNSISSVAQHPHNTTQVQNQSKTPHAFIY